MNDRHSSPSQHPSVPTIEKILTVAASRSEGTTTSDGKVVADRAIWFCACSSLEDAPTWLIYESADGKLGWCRMPNGTDVDDLVDATLVTGDHVAPEEVLQWLMQDQNTDWLPGADWTVGDGTADSAAIQEVGRKIRELQ